MRWTPLWALMWVVGCGPASEDSTREPLAGQLLHGPVVKVPCTSPAPLPLAQPQILARFAGTAEELVLDGKHAFLAVSKGPRTGAIARVGLVDGAVEWLAEGSLLTGLTIDATRLYWTEGDTVRSVDKDGGEPRTLAEGQSYAAGITCLAGTLFWANTGALNGSVMRLSDDAGTGPAAVAQGEFRPFHLAGDEAYVYWTSYGTFQLWRAPHQGGEATHLAPGASVPGGLVLDPAAIFWAADDRVFSLPKKGGELVELAASQRRPRGLALDECHLYWAAGDQVVRVNKRGGPGEVVAFGQAAPAVVKVDLDYIYWTVDGALLRRAR
ncbi:MAG: hypothetical protein ACOZIN_07155 [Myxococcota bacterium]